MAVLGIVSGAMVWVGCLATLWGLTLDTALSERLAMVALLLLECWWLCARRWRLLSMVEWAIARVGWKQRIPLTAALRHRLGTTRDDGKKRMRLLAAAGVLTVVGGIVSTLWIPLAGFLCSLLGRVFLFGETTWWLIERLLIAAGLLPMAIGLVVLAYATYVVRVTGGRDTYASVVRDWLASLTVAAFALAVMRFFGWDLLAVVWSVAGVMLVVSLVSVSRAEVPTHPRKTMLPFGQPERGVRRFVEYGFGGLTLLLLVQLRLFADVTGLNAARQMAWVGLSLGLLGFFLSRLDRRSHAPSRRQIIGAGWGVLVGLLCQVGELTHAVTLDGSARMTMILLAVFAQIPIMSLGAIYMNHTRRNHALAGGGVGGYVHSLFRGAVLFGFLPAWLLLHGGGVAWLVVAMLVLVRLGLAGRKLALPDHRAAWIMWPVVTALCLGGFVLDAATRMDDNYQLGSGLTLQTQGERFKLRHGYLPRRPARRDPAITEAVGEVFRAVRGRWWLVASDQADLPERPETNPDPSVYTRIFATGAAPEPLVGNTKRWPPVSFSHPNYFRFARHNSLAGLGCEFFDGVFLAPVPADHPIAWDCYNETLLQRVRRMTLTRVRQPDSDLVLTSTGLMALRTQTSPEHIRYLLHVARTFHEVVKNTDTTDTSGWALVALRTKGVDVLLLGPHEVLVDPARGELLYTLEKIANENGYVYLVPIEKLWPGLLVDVAPIRVVRSPAESAASMTTIDGFRAYLNALKIKLPPRPVE